MGVMIKESGLVAFKIRGNFAAGVKKLPHVITCPFLRERKKGLMQRRGIFRKRVALHGSHHFLEGVLELNGGGMKRHKVQLFRLDFSVTA